MEEERGQTGGEDDNISSVKIIKQIVELNGRSCPS